MDRLARFAGTPALIVTEYPCEAETLPLVTEMTNGYVPVAVGVPEIVIVLPVDVASAKPRGKAPLATDQMNGPVALPVTVSVAPYGTVVVPFGSVAGEIPIVGCGDDGQLLFDGAV